MVNQVQVVAILMIVNGALVSIMGLFYSLMGPTMFAITQLGPPPGGGAGGPPPLDLRIMSAIYLVIGLPVMACGILNIVAGIRSLSLRGRTLALVALFSNLAPLFTCYCLFTSLPLMIYGLIVFFQADVAHAFAMVAQGVPASQFKGARRHPEEDDDEGWEDEGPPRDPTEPPPPSRNIQRGPKDTYRRPQPEE